MEEEVEDSSRRKRKVGMDGSFTGNVSMRPRAEDWMEKEGVQVMSRSYRESLLRNVGTKDCWWQWSKEEEEKEAEDYGADTDFDRVLNPNEGIVVDRSDPLCLKFYLDEKERERLGKPFRSTLIVKLMGRTPAYRFMVMKLKRLWARKGEIEIFDMENDFFLVSFQDRGDYMDALTGGPWVIADAYLSVARWRPEFNPRQERIVSLIAWVRIPDLPAPLFDKKFLLNLGNVIGKAIRLDIHTAQRTRGRFARMCVELDLTKPLIPEFVVDGHVLSMVYESMGLLCKKCGRFGHVTGNCEGMDMKEGETQRGDGDMHKEVSERKGSEGIIEGLWKTVQKGRRSRRGVEQEQGQ